MLAGSDNQEKVLCFYDSDELQQYSLTAHNKDINTKQLLMQYVVDYVKDADIITNAIKPSKKLNSLCYTTHAIPILTDDGMQLFTSDDVTENCGKCNSKLLAEVSNIFRKVN